MYSLIIPSADGQKQISNLHLSTIVRILADLHRNGFPVASCQIFDGNGEPVEIEPITVH